MTKLNKIIKKVLRESIIDWDLHHRINKTPTIFESENQYTSEERKLKLIQKYLDEVWTPQYNFICESKVSRLVEKNLYMVRIHINSNEKVTRDELDDIVDDVWEHIFNMFEVPVSVYKTISKC
jgi:hypothetical protein